MDYKFLDKVVDQIVRETRVNYDMGVMTFPYFHQDSPVTINLPYQYSIPPIHTKPSFDRHCKEIYGLNNDEVKYVWNEYRDIIKDNINNG